MGLLVMAIGWGGTGVLGMVENGTKNFCAEFCNRRLLSYVKCCEMRECLYTGYGMMLRWLCAAVGSGCCYSTGSSTTH